MSNERISMPWWWRRTVQFADKQADGPKAAIYCFLILFIGLFGLPLAAFYLGVLIGRIEKFDERAPNIAALVAMTITAAAVIAWEWVFTNLFGGGGVLLLVGLMAYGATVSLYKRFFGKGGGRGRKGRKERGAALAARRAELERIMPHKREWEPHRPALGRVVFDWTPGYEPALALCLRLSLRAQRKAWEKADKAKLAWEAVQASPQAQEQAIDQSWAQLRKRPVVTIEHEGHVLVFGPEGSGKSAAALIPLILSPASDPAIQIISSVKDDLYEHTAGHRATLGDIYIYNPTGVDTLRWSPIDGAKTWDDAARIAGSLISQAGLSDKNAAFFENVAKPLLSACLLAANAGGHNLGEMLSWIADPVRAHNNKVIEKAFTAAPPEGWEQAKAFWNGKLNADPKTREREFDTLQSALEPFYTKAVQRSADTTTGEAFNIREFLRSERPGTLYLCANRADQKRFRAVFVTFIDAIFEELIRLAAETPGGRVPNWVLMVLDELPNTAPPTGLDEHLATTRSQNITIVSAAQDLSQLEKRYGGEVAKTIVNNSRSRVFLSGLADLATLGLATTLGGQKVVETFSQTVRKPGPLGGGEKESEQQGETSESLLPADVVRQLGTGGGLLIHGGLPPVILDMVPYFVDPTLRKRAALPAPPFDRSQPEEPKQTPPGDGEAPPDEPGAETTVAEREDLIAAYAAKWEALSNAPDEDVLAAMEAHDEDDDPPGQASLFEYEDEEERAEYEFDETLLEAPSYMQPEYTLREDV